MNKKLLKDYFSFSRKERNAVLILVLLIIAVFIVPYYFPNKNYELDASLEKAISQEPEAAESDAEKHYRVNAPANSNSSYYNDGYKKSDYFYFDPNTLSPDGWRRLGLKPRTIETIGKYLSRGGSFHDAADLKKVFGLSPKLAAELMPFVAIKSTLSPATKTQRPAYATTEKKHYVPVNVDVNMADSAHFLALNGIGPTLAGRIIKFRDKLGGFYDLKQVGEVYGLQDSNFQKIAPQLLLSASSVKKIDLNSADLTTLGSHPYIGRRLAQLIIQYRQQHGNFKSLDDLSNIEIITPQLIKKIGPYLVANN